jgi:hypothetical protein
MNLWRAIQSGGAHRAAIKTTTILSTVCFALSLATTRRFCVAPLRTSMQSTVATHNVHGCTIWTRFVASLQQHHDPSFAFPCYFNLLPSPLTMCCCAIWSCFVASLQQHHDPPFEFPCYFNLLLDGMDFSAGVLAPITFPHSRQWRR